jgi:hypothetical protein
MRRNKHIGSTLDEFLKEEGVSEAFGARASAELIAWLKRRPQADVEKAAAARPKRNT